jgi:uncharacterized membrane protein
LTDGTGCATLDGMEPITISEGWYVVWLFYTMLSAVIMIAVIVADGLKLTRESRLTARHNKRVLQRAADFLELGFSLKKAKERAEKELEREAIVALTVLDSPRLTPSDSIDAPLHSE